MKKDRRKRERESMTNVFVQVLMRGELIENEEYNSLSLSFFQTATSHLEMGERKQLDRESNWREREQLERERESE